MCRYVFNAISYMYGLYLFFYEISILESRSRSTAQSSISSLTHPDSR